MLADPLARSLGTNAPGRADELRNPVRFGQQLTTAFRNSRPGRRGSTGQQLATYEGVAAVRLPAKAAESAKVVRSRTSSAVS
ncbi:MAG: hypothetical protein JWO31_2148 [Phycisphaerales bacterium]|nr:hypothetical protein [Phycisphaerales bacterium]